MKNQYDSKEEKSFKNTHKLHKNSKTYLDAQNKFAPKLKLLWVVSDQTQTWPAHCSGQAAIGETPFSTESPLVLKFFRVGVAIFRVHGFSVMRQKKFLGSETTHDNRVGSNSNLRLNFRTILIEYRAITPFGMSSAIFLRIGLSRVSVHISQCLGRSLHISRCLC